MPQFNGDDDEKKKQKELEELISRNNLGIIPPVAPQSQPLGGIAPALPLNPDAINILKNQNVLQEENQQQQPSETDNVRVMPGQSVNVGSFSGDSSFAKDEQPMELPPVPEMNSETSIANLADLERIGNIRQDNVAATIVAEDKYAKGDFDLRDIDKSTQVIKGMITESGYIPDGYSMKSPTIIPIDAINKSYETINDIGNSVNDYIENVVTKDFAKSLFEKYGDLSSVDNTIIEKEIRDNINGFKYNKFAETGLVPKIDESFDDNLKSLVTSDKFMQGTSEQKNMYLVDYYMRLNGSDASGTKAFLESMENYKYPVLNLMIAKSQANYNIQEINKLLDKYKGLNPTAYSFASDEGYENGLKYIKDAIGEKEYNKLTSISSERDVDAFVQNIAALRIAKGINEEIVDLDYENESSFLTAFANGWSNGWDGAAPFFAGLQDLGENVSISNVIGYVESKKDITEGEDQLYKTTGMFNYFKSNSEQGWGWDIGKDILPVCISFAGELASTGGLYTGAKATLTAGVNASARSGFLSTMSYVLPDVVNFGVKATDGLAHLVATGVRTGAARPTEWAAGVVKRMTPDHTYFFDAESNSVVNEVNSIMKKDLSEAVLTEYLSQYVEVWTEQLGEKFLPWIFGRAKNLSSSALLKISQSSGISVTALNRIKSLYSNPAIRDYFTRLHLEDISKKYKLFSPDAYSSVAVTKLFKSAAINSIPAEISEEWIAGRLQPLVEGTDDPFFTEGPLSTLGEEAALTSLAMAPLYLMGGGVNISLYAYNKIDRALTPINKRNYNDIVSNVLSYDREQFNSSIDNIRESVKNKIESTAKQQELNNLIDERAKFEAGELNYYEGAQSFSDYIAAYKSEVSSAQKILSGINDGMYTPEQIVEIENNSSIYHPELSQKVSWRASQYSKFMENKGANEDYIGYKDFKSYLVNEILNPHAEVVGALDNYIASDSPIYFPDIDKTISDLPLMPSEKVAIEQLYDIAKSKYEKENPYRGEVELDEQRNVKSLKLTDQTSGNKVSFNEKTSSPGSYNLKADGLTESEAVNVVQNSILLSNLEEIETLSKVVSKSNLSTDGQKQVNDAIAGRLLDLAKKAKSTDSFPIGTLAAFTRIYSNATKSGVKNKENEDAVKAEISRIIKASYRNDTSFNNVKAIRTMLVGMLQANPELYDVDFVSDLFQSTRVQTLSSKVSEVEQIDDFEDTDISVEGQTERQKKITQAVKGFKAEKLITWKSLVQTNKSAKKLDEALDSLKEDGYISSTEKQFLIGVVTLIPSSLLNFTDVVVAKNSQFARSYYIESTGEIVIDPNTIGSQLILEITEEIVHSVHHSIANGLTMKTDLTDLEVKNISGTTKSAVMDAIVAMYTSKQYNVADFNRLRSMSKSKMTEKEKSDYDAIRAYIKHFATIYNFNANSTSFEFQHQGITVNYESLVSSYIRYNEMLASGYDISQSLYYSSNFAEYFARTFSDYLIGKSVYNTSDTGFNQIVESSKNWIIKKIIAPIYSKILKNTNIAFDKEEVGELGIKSNLLSSNYTQGDIDFLEQLYLDMHGEEQISGIPKITFTEENGKIIARPSGMAASRPLLAPNGKPSNLSLSDYSIVRTKEFKDWFGDWELNPKDSSIMIDENGEPRLFYHGTNVDFNEFDKSKITEGNDEGNTGDLGYGFYFATDKDSAEWFATNLVDTVKKEGKKIVKSYFLNIRKPARLDLFFNSFGENSNTAISKKEMGKLASAMERIGDDFGPTSYEQFGYDGVITDEQVVTIDPNQILFSSRIIGASRPKSMNLETGEVVTSEGLKIKIQITENGSKLASTPAGSFYIESLANGKKVGQLVDGTFYVEAILDGKRIGDAWFTYDDSVLDTVYSLATEVEEKYQRKGVGTAMYNFFKKSSGLDIYPSRQLLKPGESLWNSMREDGFLGALRPSWTKTGFDGIEKMPANKVTKSIRSLVADVDHSELVKSINNDTANSKNEKAAYEETIGMLLDKIDQSDLFDVIAKNIDDIGSKDSYIISGINIKRNSTKSKDIFSMSLGENANINLFEKNKDTGEIKPLLNKDIVVSSNEISAALLEINYLLLEDSFVSSMEFIEDSDSSMSSFRSAMSSFNESIANNYGRDSVLLSDTSILSIGRPSYGKVKQLLKGNELRLQVPSALGAARPTRSISQSAKTYLQAIKSKNKNVDISPESMKQTIDDILTNASAFDTKGEMRSLMRDIIELWKNEYLKRSLVEPGSLRLSEIKAFTKTPYRHKEDSYKSDIDKIGEIVTNSNYRNILSVAIKARNTASRRYAKHSKSDVVFHEALNSLLKANLSAFETEQELAEYTEWLLKTPDTVDVQSFVNYSKAVVVKSLMLKAEAKRDGASVEPNVAASISPAKLAEKDMMLDYIKFISRYTDVAKYATKNKHIAELISFDLQNASSQEIKTHLLALRYIYRNNGKLNSKIFNYIIKTRVANDIENFRQKQDIAWTDILNKKSSRDFLERFLVPTKLGNIKKYNIKDIISLIEGNTKDYSGALTTAMITPLDDSSNRMRGLIKKILSPMATTRKGLNPQSSESSHIIGIHSLLQQKPTYRVTGRVLETLEKNGIDVSDLAIGSVLTRNDTDTEAYNFVNSQGMRSIADSIILSFGEVPEGFTEAEVQGLLDRQSNGYDKDISKSITDSKYTHKHRESILKQTGFESIAALTEHIIDGNSTLTRKQQKYLDDTRKIYKDISSGKFTNGVTLEYTANVMTGEKFLEIDDYAPIIRYMSMRDTNESILDQKAGDVTDSERLFMNLYSDFNVNTGFLESRRSAISTLNTNVWDMLKTRVDQQLFYMMNEEQRVYLQNMLKTDFFSDTEGVGNLNLDASTVVKQSLKTYFNRGVTKSKIELRNNPILRTVRNTMNNFRTLMLGTAWNAPAQVSSIIMSLQTMQGSPAQRFKSLAWAVTQQVVNLNTKESDAIANFIEEYAPEVAFRGLSDYEIANQGTGGYKGLYETFLVSDFKKESYFRELLANVSDSERMNGLQLLPLMYFDRIAARISFLGNYKNFLDTKGIEFDVTAEPDRAGIEFAIQSVRDTQGTDNNLYKSIASQNIRTKGDGSFMSGDIDYKGAVGEVLLQSQFNFKSFAMNDAKTLAKFRTRLINAVRNENVEEGTRLQEINNALQAITYNFLGKFMFYALKGTMATMPVYAAWALVGDDDKDNLMLYLSHKFSPFNMVMRSIFDYTSLNEPLNFALGEMGQRTEKWWKDSDELTYEERLKYPIADPTDMIGMFNDISETFTKDFAKTSSSLTSEENELIDKSIPATVISTLDMMALLGKFVPLMSSTRAFMKEYEKQVDIQYNGSNPKSSTTKITR